MTPDIVSPILFHCWPHANSSQARGILESILKRGLLLTTNSGQLDTFAVDRGQGVVQMEVMQHARVCFTDIPFNLLAKHGVGYGKYGVGFKRETVIEWGGLPAWYVPNHWSAETLKCIGPAIVNGLHGIRDAADHFQAMVGVMAEHNIPISIKYTHGATLSSAEIIREMKNLEQLVYAMLSFVKEMSPSSVEDHRYLDEREWRIVSGIGLRGREFNRELTPEEKTEFITKKPGWGEKRMSSDINIHARYGSAPVIDSFRFFEGNPEKGSVSQMIDTILVPNDDEAKWASDLVSRHDATGETTSPKVVVFPSVGAG